MPRLIGARCLDSGKFTACGESFVQFALQTDLKTRSSCRLFSRATGLFKPGREARAWWKA